MDGNVVVGLAASVFGGAVVATISFVANRAKAQAEARKIDAETDKIRAETALLLVRNASGVDGMPEANSGLPAGWLEYGQYSGVYELGVDRSGDLNDKPSGTIRSVTDNVRGFVTMMQDFRAGRLRGCRVRLSAFVRTEGVEQHAWIWMRVDGVVYDEDNVRPDRGILAFDNMSDRSIRGTTGWKRYEVVLDVANEARAIAFGFALAGKGQIWANSFSLDEVDVDVPVTAPSGPYDRAMNLSFDE